MIQKRRKRKWVEKVLEEDDRFEDEDDEENE
jgi:hypothetical protein